MPKKKTVMKYDLIYHVPVEQNLFLKADIQSRSETHVTTYPHEVTVTDPSRFDREPMKSVYRKDGWTVTEMDNGFTCTKDSFTVEYANIRMERI